jgi:hypothetical protein
VELSVVIPIVIAVVALVVAVITMYYNKKAVPVPAPKAELTVDVVVTPLLPRTASEVQGKIKVQYEDGGTLTDPRLVQIRLHNTGSAAVSEAMYDGHPYVVRLGTTVVGELLRQDNSATGQSKPLAVLVGDELRIGPGAIHPNQRLTYALLVDGQEYIEQVSPLLDIDVQRSADRQPRPTAPRRSWVQSHGAGLLSVLAAAATFTALLLFFDDLPTKQGPVPVSVTGCRIDGKTLTCDLQPPPAASPTPSK